MTQPPVRVCFSIACLLLVSWAIHAQEKKAPAKVAKKPAPPKIVPSNVPEVGVALNLSHASTKRQRDMCIWVHPKHSFLSAFITCDTTRGKILVYDLNGKVLDSHDVLFPGNIDVRYDFPLNGKKVDIVVCNQKLKGPRLRVFVIDPKTRKLTQVDNGKMYTGTTRGSCLYRSRRTGKFYSFVATSGGEVRQYELLDAGAGKVKRSRAVAKFKLHGSCEAMVADDEKGWVFIAETGRGIWLQSAEPDVKFKTRGIAGVGRNELKAGVRGMAIYRGRGDEGYFLVSSGGNNQISVYDRKTFKYLGGFRLRLAENVVGIEVCNTPMGGRFASGLFSCSAYAKGKRLGVFVAPWDKIANSFKPPLTAQSRWDPRRLDLVKEEPKKPRKPKEKSSKSKPAKK